LSQVYVYAEGVKPAEEPEFFEGKCKCYVCRDLEGFNE
jgi:hypothetical protein